ncbi:hypothetical protein ACP26L_27170 [Paenibacillus sp. S-38]|uniref:hypothetical protein n=1 Tax=Paenibacillus sp. S-38 TaxID=3416710 RepID=UPI003CF783DF
MRTQRMGLWLAAAVIFASTSTLALPYAKAEPEMAEQSVMPYITLLDDFKLYKSEQTRSSEVIGALNGLQSVQLAPIKANEMMNITIMNKVPVTTWLGTAWINLKEGAYKYGQLEWKEEAVTLLQPETELYGAPMKSTAYKLGPQQVQAVASLPVCDPFTSCYSMDKWYLIRTSWLGDKWILPYHYAEKYKASPVEGYISIEEEQEVYLYPDDEPLKDEPKVKPQIIKPAGKYLRVSRMVPPWLWYQVETEKGLRWISMGDSRGLGFENVEPVDQKLDLPVPFQYYITPFSYEEPSPAVEPQTVQALGRRGDWYFVLTDGRGRWINPAMEIAARITGDLEKDAELGVRASSKQVILTAQSVGLDKPYLDEGRFSGDDILTFTSQVATASRVWNSPNGETWYYIHTWRGAKWVRP